MISLLLLLPWIQNGFQNPNENYLGLNQTRKSLIILLIIEIIFYLVLFMTLPEPNPKIAGESSFA